MNPRCCRTWVVLLVMGCCVRVPAQQGLSPAGHCEPKWHRELQECPDFGLKLDQDRVCGCTGTVMEICADFSYDRDGRAVWMDSEQCGETRPEEPIVLEKMWKWRVEGVTVEPPSGEGKCASFLLKEPGIGHVEFIVEGHNHDWPQCDTMRTTRRPISAHRLQLKLERPYLGIRMTDPIGEPRDSMVAHTIFDPSPACKAYEWELVGVAELLGARDPDGAWVTITEQGVPSPRYRHDEIRVARHCVDVTNFTVVKVDVDVGVQEDQEEKKGRDIRLNDNDSDGSGIPDLKEAPLLSSDPDLYPVLISIQPTGLPAEEEVQIQSTLPLYEDTRKEVAAAAAYSVSRLPLTLYAEGVAVSAEESVHVSHGLSPAIDRAKFRVYSLGMVPDFNHDRHITDQDKYQMLTNAPFRFWVNDDDDRGDVAEDDSDVPGQDSRADYRNDVVDGRCDLTDFFPVWLDLHDMLKIFSEDFGFECRLSQADGAVKVVYTDLSRAAAGDYLIRDGVHCGPGLSQGANEATSIQVTPEGVKLDKTFLDLIAGDRNKGVLLVEATRPSTAPLVLDIWSEGSAVCSLSLDLSLSGVEEMYRWINLRPSGGQPTSTGAPANTLDSLSNGKNVFFLHGFNVSAEASRGWSAEVFKRLYWSGSRAKFWGMTWDGDVGLVNALHYQEDVANALHTAGFLSAAIGNIAGEKIVLAHSLGNMVVSAAIQDYGVGVDKYFMLNAAVATESYRPASFNDATAGNYMLHEDWVGYSNKTWCAKWFELFSSPDDRAKLTWKDRFSNVLSVAYNFYSSGDEIFEVYTNGTPSVFSGGPFHLERRAWQKQEHFKGRTVWGLPIPILGGTDWAGWGFRGECSMTEANAATPDNLRTNAVFRQEPAPMSSSNITAQGVSDIIAQGVPALSCAAGVNEIPMPGNRNYDANDASHKPNGWGRSGAPYNDRWLHSDLKIMAYFYTYDLFNQLASQGGLQ